MPNFDSYIMLSQQYFCANKVNDMHTIPRSIVLNF